MSASLPSAVLHDVSLTWPDGDRVLTHLDAVIGPGRSGLVGRNGCGKSTVLRLLAGTLHPDRGAVIVDGTVGYVPQDVTLDTTRRVEEVLGVADVLAAVRAIEAGDVDERQFTAVGDDWDAEARVRAVLDELGLQGVGLDRRVGELSGGEAVLLALAAELLRGPDVLLLDEPTNNLDRHARERLYQVVQSWRGTLVVVTHDRDLLQLVDRIGELRDGTIAWYGGNWDAYTAQVERDRQARERDVRVAEQDLARQRRDLASARIVLDRRRRYGQRMQDEKREPKIVMGARKRAAQESAGRIRTGHEDAVEDARRRLREAEDAVPDDRTIRVALPGTAVPAGRTVLTAQGLATRTHTGLDLELRGPERIAVTGPNGSGKTALLDTLTGRVAPRAGRLAVHVPVGYLPQRLDVLDDTATVLGNVARRAPDVPDQDIRAQLARLLFRGRRAEQVVGTLSGGERFRAALASILLAQPAPQLLVLDEPTNNLDLDSVGELVQALAAYRGALVVVSHDERFLADLGVARRLDLGATGVGPGSE